MSVFLLPDKIDLCVHMEVFRNFSNNFSSFLNSFQLSKASMAFHILHNIYVRSLVAFIGRFFFVLFPHQLS